MRVQHVTITIDHTCTATKNVVVYNKERGKCSVPVNGDVLHVSCQHLLSLVQSASTRFEKNTYLAERWHHGSQCPPCSFDPTSSRRCEAAGGVSEAAGDEKKGGNGVEGTFNKDMTNDEMTFEAHTQIVKP